MKPADREGKVGWVGVGRRVFHLISLSVQTLENQIPFRAESFNNPELRIVSRASICVPTITLNIDSIIASHVKVWENGPSGIQL